MIASLCVLVMTLTASEQRGREIYRYGAGPAGRAITATIGRGETTELPASTLACASCHGPEGRGVPEGTITPADIRWATLSKVLLPNATSGIGSRRRPRYDDALLSRAIREGRDSGDMPLSPIMPRYRMDDRDLADLLAYLHRLGNEPQPGLTDKTLAMLTAVPLSGPRAATGELTRKVIEAYFADVNAQGGLHGRTLQLEAIDTAAADGSKRVGAALRAEETFAIVCASLADLDANTRSLIDRERIPLITPLPSDGASNATAPSSFFLFSDLESQALALVTHVGAGKRNVHLLHGKTPGAVAAAAAVRERAASLQWTTHDGWPVKESSANENDVLLLIGVDPAEAFRMLESQTWRPQVLIAGAPLNSFPAYANKILMAAPTVPTDLTREGQQELRSFADRHRLPQTQVAAQIAAYVSAKIFVEGLKRAGRELTREQVISQLETLYQFPTQLTPPITFSRNRHVGSAGAFILAVDAHRKTFVPTGGWVPAH